MSVNTVGTSLTHCVYYFFDAFASIQKMKKSSKKTSRSRHFPIHQHKKYVGIKRDNTLMKRDLVNDRRRFREDDPRRENGTKADYVHYDETDDQYRSKPSHIFTGRITFRDPKTVTICQRRISRRRNLFRLKKIGKGISGAKKRRFNKYSHVVCKRK